MLREKTILLTGATGFVGSAIASKLDAKEVRLLGRSEPELRKHIFCKSNINGSADFSPFMEDVDVVIHSAARAHIMNDTSDDPVREFKEINTDGTLNLAKQAADAGVKRFIFLSSIKVNGESTNENTMFTSNDPIEPKDAYGESKAKAEKGLRKLSSETGMDVVIIRPPLVYGPGVKANFDAMLKLAKKNLPLPLGAIHNKRSFVALGNLVDLIITCICHPNAENQTFLVSDNQDVSTTVLLQMMTRAAGKTPILIPIPVSWLRLIGNLTGKQAVIERLCGNLQVDISHTRNILDWSPPITMEEGISKCLTPPR